MLLASIGLLFYPVPPPPQPPQAPPHVPPTTLQIGVIETQKKRPNYEADVIRPLTTSQAAGKHINKVIAAEARAEQARVIGEAAKQAALEAAEAPPSPSPVSQAIPSVGAATQPVISSQTNYGNNYAYGNCTYYVASRVSVPASMGNATAWSGGLRRAGWRSGAPIPGAVGVSHAGWAGHVVYVESVGAGVVNISEMNWNGGFNRVSTRTTPVGEFEYFYR